MSGVATFARNDITAQLTSAGFTVHKTPPRSYSDAFIFLSESSPFITPADGHGVFSVTFDLLIFAAHSRDDAVNLARLDDMVDRVISSLWTDTNLTIEMYTTTQTPDSTPRLVAKATVSVEVKDT